MITREELVTMQAVQRLEKKIPELRDRFAMSALNGTLRATFYTDKELEMKVEQAYKLADMMLKVREK